MVTKNVFVKWAFANLPWIFIVAGLLMLYCGHYIEHIRSPQTQVEESVRENIVLSLLSGTQAAGAAILGAGIFAAVLKSFQFTGVFQEALAKVIYSPECLQQQDRGKLEDTWRLVSKALYTRKFPGINKKIEDVILTTFFPIGQSYYYQEFRLFYTDIDIIRDPQSKHCYAQYTHRVNARIIPTEKTGEFNWVNSYEIETDPNSYRTIELFEFVSPKGGVQNFTKEFQAAVNGRFEMRLKCDDEYEFTKVEKRKFRLDLPQNDRELFEITKITNGMIVNVRHTNNVKVAFIYKTGKEFYTLLDEKDAGGNRHLIKEFKDILLPSQGFCLVLGKA
jgi:hypothetical protein